MKTQRVISYVLFLIFIFSATIITEAQESTTLSNTREEENDFTLNIEPDSSINDDMMEIIKSELTKTFQESGNKMMAKIKELYSRSIFLTISEVDEEAVYVRVLEDINSGQSIEKYRVSFDMLASKIKQISSKNKDRLYSVIIEADNNVIYKKLKYAIGQYEEAAVDACNIDTFEIKYFFAEK